MDLTKDQISILKDLMSNSAQKGNLANSGLVLQDGQVLATSESLVVTNNDATDHSERMLVSMVCRKLQKHYTPGLTMVTVVEPCLMCLSACSQSGYQKVAYIIPAKKYVEKIAWMTDNREVDKQKIAQTMSDGKLELVHLEGLEGEFCEVFEKAMERLLK